jgi:DNA (cytosine-5)-methyltransferase 1
MIKPRLLDLFCGAGGVAVGYSRAGFEVIGVDLRPQPNFPFQFIQADALSMNAEFLASFDAIHASPPCQAYSDLAKRNRNGDKWPKLIEPVRGMLSETGLPYVIENVEGAPLRNPTVLCGTMFKGLRVIRHRLFESNFFIMSPLMGDIPRSTPSTSANPITARRTTCSTSSKSRAAEIALLLPRVTQWASIG